MLPAAPSLDARDAGGVRDRSASPTRRRRNPLLGRDSLRRRAMMEGRYAFRCRPSRTSFKPSASDV
jgi:hypothetical protein